MLNGAQGDDDEAHGGHFALVTGRIGARGAIGDWIAPAIAAQPFLNLCTTSHLPLPHCFSASTLASRARAWL